MKDLLRRYRGAGIKYIIPSVEQRPWSPPVGYFLCVPSGYCDQPVTERIAAHSHYADSIGCGDRCLDERETIQGVDFYKGRAERVVLGENTFEQLLGSKLVAMDQRQKKRLRKISLH